MLVRITNQCNQSCSHCFHEGVGPKADHMSRETFDQTVEFAKRIGVHCLILTGGEPTMNPLLLDFIRSFKKGEFILALTSNGSFAARPRFTKELMKLCDRKGVSIQVTNDRRFYPNPLPKSKVWDELVYVDHVPMIYPCRRVKENGHTVTRTQPSCFNLRSLGRRSTFSIAARQLEMLGRFCVPAIGADGRVFIGEADTCTPIGSINDPLLDIDIGLSRARCRKCGLVEMMPPEYREAIGEL